MGEITLQRKNLFPIEKMKKNDFLIKSLNSKVSVQKLLDSTGYDSKKIHLIEGDVSHIKKESIPKKISFIHLDTDFYKSTKSELINFYPNLIPKGVAIIDDYPTESGCTKAVDEYFNENNPLLIRIASQGRLLIK